MRPLHFPPDVLAEIEHDRFHHPVPQVQRRMELLRLAAYGLPRPDLIRLSGLSKATVQRRLDEYRDGGLDAVRRWDFRGRANGLAPHAATLEEHFARHPPATVADARTFIEEATGVRRGLTQVRLFLKKTAASGTARRAGCRPRPIPSPNSSS
jgi:transposase